MPQTLLKDLKARSEKSLEHLRMTYAGVRTGRAHPALVEDIKVDYFGTPTPIKQMGTLSTPEPRLIVITPWDKSAIKAIEKAIQTSSLGVNPQSDGDVIRLTLPELTRERRIELTKLVNKYAEETRVAIRNVRREINDQLKKMEKESVISEDDQRKFQKEIQDLTDECVKKADQLFTDKEKEIMDE